MKTFHLIKQKTNKSQTMKKALTIGVVLFLALTAIKSCQQTSTVSQQEFEEKHFKLNQRIDTMQVKLDQIQWLVDVIDTKVDSIAIIQNQHSKDLIIIKKGIDTLKTGQVIIYGEIINSQSSQNSKKNWADKLIDFLQ